MTGDIGTLQAAIDALDEQVRAMLREDLPSQRDTAIAAMDAANWSKARDIVHTVNGSASFCRLHELQSAAAALELELDRQQATTESRREFLDALERTLSALR